MSIDKIRNIGLDKLITQVYDFESLTTDELFCKFAQKINIIIEHFNYLDKQCQNNNENIKEKLDYLLGQGLEEKVAKRLLEIINDGTLGKLINETLLKNINDKVDGMKSYICTSKMNLDIEDTNSTNFDIICEYIDKGYNIFVDGNYKINVKRPYALEHDLKIYGQSNCGFNFNVKASDTTEVFTINGDVRIELNNIKITGLTQYLFNTYSLNNKVSFEMKNCYLTGNMVVLYVRSAIDDTNQNHKIVNCVIENNTLENITPSGIGIDLSKDGEIYGVFNIINSMYDNVIFRNNYVHNFKRTILYCNMDGNSDGTDETISLNRKSLIIDGNNVINDKNHFDDTKNMVIYHTLCLVKGYRCIYSNNKIEGLKSANGRPVYDVYTSTTHLLSTGNYIKNNVQIGLHSVNNNTMYNCLVKSKGNRVSSENGTRIIKNNKFIIEKEYVLSLGYSAEFAYTKFMQITTDNPLDYCIENNEIDCYIVDFGQSTISFDSYIFNNNNVKADYIMGYIVTVAKNSYFVNSEESTISICNNRFKASQPTLPTFNAITNNEMSSGIINHRYNTAEEQPTLKEIKILGNVFDLCFVNRKLAPIEYVNTYSLIFNDNFINNLNEENADSIIFDGTVIDKVIFKNNVIDGFCGVGTPVSRMPRNTYMNNKFAVKQFSGSRAGNLMHDFATGTAAKKCRGYISIKLIDNESPSHEVKFDFIVDNNLITFYENDTTGSMALTGDSGTLYYPSKTEKIHLRFLDRPTSSSGSGLLYIYNGTNDTNLKGTLEVEYILKEI